MDAERQKHLHDWLKKPECKTLELVVAAKSRLHQERALKEHFASTQYNAYEFKSAASLKSAERYEIFLQVLSEIAAATEPFQIFKALK